ncbi:hypothetical protein BD410DRAFT_852758 [Rickenella mellea]|uniref:CHAT domain-containing protein n=1 Tax=Rickenella mellea TaxID=50990 RepID=A0A4Y7QAP1_9AGAM|nr:hypothetical protein BD410DRAFT_852758 [Rickenella mellea]
MRQRKTSIPTQQIQEKSSLDRTKGESVTLEVAEIEQDIANLERGLRNSQGDDPVEGRDLYSLLSHDKSSAIVPSVDGGTSSVESSGQFKLISGGCEDDPHSLNDLGAQLLRRYELHGDIGDLQLAIRYLERAVHLTPEGHPDRPSRLAKLGISLTTRFKALGEIADIEQAILKNELAVRLTTDGDLDTPKFLCCLGTSFFERFKRLGDMADIEQAVVNHKRAVQLSPDGPQDKPNCLFNLGNSYLMRFDRLGQIEDVEQAVIFHERAVQLTSDGDLDKPNRLSSLGCSLLLRFERLGEIVDIERSVSNHEQAVQLASDGHPEKARFLSNLGNSFDRRFGRLGEMTDVEKAILSNEGAIELTPDGNPRKPEYFSRAGNSYWKRFDRLRQATDIEKATFNHNCAVQLLPDRHPFKPMYLSNLGNCYWTRFEFLGEIADLDQAIFNQERAVQLTPDGHREKPYQLNNLGNSLSSRHLKTGRYEDLLESIAAYRTSAHLPYGPPSARLYAANKWAWLARRERSRHPSHPPVLDAYKVAFDLLHLVAWVGLSIDSRHHEILAASSLACNAAAAAISENDPQLALTWLEQGRSIVWGQILQLRTPFDELRQAHPRLAAELTQISEQLEHGTSGDHFTINGSGEGAVQKYRQLARDWDRIVGEVRQKPDFERFLMPKLFSELRHAARNGPVVILNVSEYGCDALIIESLSQNLHHVPLETFSYQKAQSLRQSLHDVLSHQCLRNRHASAEPLFSDDFGGDNAFLPILAELWKSVVKPVLDHLESLQDKYLRITWCPTGPLAFLPVHAAGLYSPDGTSSNSLPDIAISSYTPTLTALLRNSQHATPDTSEFKLLAVIQASSPGTAPLPGTLEELRIIRNHVSDQSSQILQGGSATTSNVLSAMEECSWVHLACHGVQDISSPMESGLLLQDGRLNLSKIIQKQLHHAEFVFLSACQTATGDETRPEEAVHLAAGMLLAGYRGAVATMWSIRDDDAPFVADKVYARLLNDGRPNGSKGAEALHLAILELRKKPGGCQFSSWVPFVYMGV